MLEYKKNLIKSREVEIRYLLNLPKDYEKDENKKWPLIVFLHGAGERGSNLNDLKKYGIHRYLHKKELPFVVLSPQCSEDTFWDMHFKDLKILIEEIKSELKIDHRMIYLAGISMGAYGAWNFAMQEPDLFSAIVSIAGGAMLPKYAHVLKYIPIWAIHGEKDTEVSVVESQKIVEKLISCGGNVRYTVIPNAGHEVCTTAFENDEIYNWLLSHKKD